MSVTFAVCVIWNLLTISLTLTFIFFNKTSNFFGLYWLYYVCSGWCSPCFVVVSTLMIIIIYLDREEVKHQSTSSTRDVLVIYKSAHLIVTNWRPIRQIMWRNWRSFRMLLAKPHLCSYWLLLIGFKALTRWSITLRGSVVITDTWCW